MDFPCKLVLTETHHVILNILEYIKRVPIAAMLSKGGAEHNQLCNVGCHGKDYLSNHVI